MGHGKMAADAWLKAAVEWEDVHEFERASAARDRSAEVLRAEQIKSAEAAEARVVAAERAEAAESSRQLDTSLSFLAEEAVAAAEAAERRAMALTERAKVDVESLAEQGAAAEAAAEAVTDASTAKRVLELWSDMLTRVSSLADVVDEATSEYKQAAAMWTIAADHDRAAAARQQAAELSVLAEGLAEAEAEGERMLAAGAWMLAGYNQAAGERESGPSAYERAAAAALERAAADYERADNAADRAAADYERADNAADRHTAALERAAALNKAAAALERAALGLLERAADAEGRRVADAFERAQAGDDYERAMADYERVADVRRYDFMWEYTAVERSAMRAESLEEAAAARAESLEEAAAARADEEAAAARKLLSTVRSYERGLDQLENVAMPTSEIELRMYEFERRVHDGRARVDRLAAASVAYEWLADERAAVEWADVGGGFVGDVDRLAMLEWAAAGWSSREGQLGTVDGDVAREWAAAAAVHRWAADEWAAAAEDYGRGWREAPEPAAMGTIEWEAAVGHARVADGLEREARERAVAVGLLS